MSGNVRDGDGMEPSKSITDDELVDAADDPSDDADSHDTGTDTGTDEDFLDDGLSENGFNVVDTKPVDVKADDTEDSDRSSADSVSGELDPDEDADLLTVEQWLSEAESVNEADTPATGQNMSEIMAELLAAAEESSQDTEEGETDEPESDSDREEGAGDEGASDKDTTAAEADSTETDTDSDKDTDENTDTATSESSEQADGAESADDVDEDAIDLDALYDAEQDDSAEDEADEQADSEDKDKADNEDKADSANESETEPAAAESDSDTNKTDSKTDADDETDQKGEHGEPKPDEPAPPTFPVRETTTEVKTSETAIIVPRETSTESSLPLARLAIAGVVLAYAALTLAWGLDTLGHRGEAMRGVQIATVDVGGSNRESLEGTIADLTDDLAAKPLELAIGSTTIETDPVTLGAGFDREAMIDEAMEAKRGGFLPLRPVIWLGNLFSTTNVEPRYVVDADTAAQAAVGVVAPELAEPVEPTLELDGNEMVVMAGSPGVMIESEEIVNLLGPEVESGEPYQLQLTPLDSDPKLDTDAVSRLADNINTLTSKPISVRVLDDEAEVSPRTLKSWIDMIDEDGEPRWEVDEERALEDLKPLFPTLGSDDQQAKFTIVDGEPIILPASESVVCCEMGSAAVLRRTITRSLPAPVTEQDEDGNDIEVEPLRTADLEAVITGNEDGIEELKSLGIIEEVSTFTTEHACCQNRVKNIQRFADLTQGVIIRPGEELSLNEHVGQRTIEKGFVADGAIALGNFEKQVGGGISQYATTFFNAAFFAGIEFLEYQSHSIYISRYPRGREATISWRRPDLKVKNNTEYGILVWNEYTPTSITVTFYSTKHLEVEALDRRRSSDRQCRIDITPRLITFPDGSQTEDSVFALYRPGEGLDCNGNSTTPEEEPTPEPPEVVTPPEEPTTPPPPPEEPPEENEVLPPPG